MGCRPHSASSPFPTRSTKPPREDSMGHTADARDASHAPSQEFSAAVAGYGVIDRSGERTGGVPDINLAPTCILVETRPTLARKEIHAAHICAGRRDRPQAQT